jgi:predicted SprT family Zn-dependent metalloprotease
MKARRQVAQVLYVYRCKCGHHGEVYHSGDGHDGEPVRCEVCYRPNKLEWDGGCHFAIVPPKVAA